MESEWFVIKDLENFTKSLRLFVYNSFGEADGPLDDLMEKAVVDPVEFETVLSQKEGLIIVKSIIKKQKLKNGSKIRYVTTEKLTENIIYALNERMISNLLMQLVKKDEVDVTFDTELNDWLFWVKDK